MLHILPLWGKIYISTPLWAFMSRIELCKSREYKPDNWPINTLPDHTNLEANSMYYPEIPMVIITQEELETIRMVDYIGIDEKEAAKLLDKSEKYLADTLKSGRKKIASAILYNRIVRIEGTSSILQCIDEND